MFGKSWFFRNSAKSGGHLARESHNWEGPTGEARPSDFGCKPRDDRRQQVGLGPECDGWEDGTRHFFKVSTFFTCSFVRRDRLLLKPFLVYIAAMNVWTIAIVMGTWAVFPTVAHPPSFCTPFPKQFQPTSPISGMALRWKLIRIGENYAVFFSHSRAHFSRVCIPV